MKTSLDTLNKNLKMRTQNLSSLTLKFHNLLMRMGDISVDIRRKNGVKDTTFEHDFCLQVDNLQKLSISSYEDVQALRSFFRGLGLGNTLETLAFKETNIICRNFNNVVRQFYREYKGLQTLVSDSPLKLKWWVMQTSCEDLLNLETQLTALSRDIQKRYD